MSFFTETGEEQIEISIGTNGRNNTGAVAIDKSRNGAAVGTITVIAAVASY